ncbi:MAG: hypothetical protein R2738_00710 [Bacteroides graminisolvens]
MNAFYSDVINQKFTYSPTAALSMYAEGGYYDRMTKRVPVSAYTHNMKYDAYNLGAGAKYLLEIIISQLGLTKNNYVIL